MRTTLFLLLLIAVPTFAAAQQATDAADAVDPTPAVQLEQSTPAPSMMAPAADADAAADDVQIEARTAPVEENVDVQEPGSSNWWWIVGAVVVGGLIVALLT